MNKNERKPKSSGTPTDSQLEQKAKNPYNFVPVRPELAATFPPVWHDAQVAAEGSELYSGELRLTMTALTPLLSGNYQYKLKEAQSWGTTLTHQGYSEDKSVIEPLRLAADDRPVVIAGSALKGMLRGAIAALASSPMERVFEQTYSYRPNAVVLKDAVIKTRPAVPVQFCEDGSVKIRVLPELMSAYFVKRAAEGAANLQYASEQGLPFTIPEGYCIKNNQFRKGGSTPISKDSFRVFRYYGGLDGRGLLAKDKASTCNYVLVKENEWNKADTNEKTIPKEIWDHFRVDTLNHLKNEISGHISSRHPGLHKRTEPEIKKEVVSAITDLQEKVFKQAPPADGRVLLYVEIDQDRVISAGHHFRYRWKYRDSTLYRNTGGQETVRPEINPLAQEQLPPPELELSLARLLFGFVSNSVDRKDEPGCRGLGGGKVSSLAGRVAINAAVEEVAAGESESARFLDADGHCNVFLKVLGAPKAMAVECYLTQGGEMLSKRQDQGTLCTYGDTLDDPSSGNLRGRKHYYHQPQAASDPRCYTQNPNDRETSEDDDMKKNLKLPLVIQGNQCAIGRFISKPGRRFRFTIRFRNLRDFELGLLMYVIEIDGRRTVELANLANAKDLVDYVQRVQSAATPEKPAFAHKLGHGRPLGLGSVHLTIDALMLLDSNGNLDEVKDRQPFVPTITTSTALSQWAMCIFFPWLRMHQYAGMDQYEYDYPKTEANGKSPIINFHNQVKTRHLKGRKYKKNLDKAIMANSGCLPDPLEDITS